MSTGNPESVPVQISQISIQKTHLNGGVIANVLDVGTIVVLKEHLREATFGGGVGGVALGGSLIDRQEAVHRPKGEEVVAKQLFHLADAR